MYLKCTVCNTFRYLQERSGATARPEKHRCSECGNRFEVLKFHCDPSIYICPDGKYWKIDSAKAICWECEPITVEVIKWVKKKVSYT